jgi:hypothetical protein
MRMGLRRSRRRLRRFRRRHRNRYLCQIKICFSFSLLFSFLFFSSGGRQISKSGGGRQHMGDKKSLYVIGTGLFFYKDTSVF